MQQALLFLSYRARSEKEIRQNLKKHEYPEDAIEYAMTRLRENRLANDNEFAQAWVENRSTFRPRSRRALTMELRQKGLDEETVKQAVAGIDEEALAYETALKRAPRLASLEWSEFRRKLSEHLARRGFPYSVVTSTVTRIWNETHTEETKYEDEDMT